MQTLIKLAVVDCGDTGCKVQGGFNGTLFSLFGTVTSLLIFITGAVSIIMIIVGGFRYVISAGNPTATEGARNTIMYAVIGLVVSLAAFAIVSFVKTNVLKG